MLEENKNRWNKLPKEIRRRYTPEELEDFFEKYINTIDRFYIISKIGETEMKAHMSYTVALLLTTGSNWFKRIPFDGMWKLISIFEDGLFEYYKDRIIDYCKTYEKYNVF